MVGWHHGLKGHEFEQTLGDSEGHHVHRDLTALAPHERLTELPVLLREKPHTSATARENLRDAPVIGR